MMALDQFLFSKIILGDPELSMHYHIRDESPPMHYIIGADLTSLVPGDKYACVAPRDTAKYIALDEKILTTKGWIKVKNLTLDDKVYGSNGLPKNIIGFSNIVNKPLYKVTTRDGRSLVVTDDHLWTVRWLSGFKPKDKRHFTYTTAELIEKYHRKRLDKRNDKIYDDFKLAIECPSPIYLPNKKLPISPYTLGALIGDGNLTNSTPRMTSDINDIEEMYSYIKGDRSKIKYPKNRSPYFSIRGIFKEIRNLRLDVTSHHKFIPKEYLWGSIEQRFELLRGLLDTDGYIYSYKYNLTWRGTVSFCTVSEQLANDVVDLVRSLGGIGKKEYYENNYGGYYLIYIKTFLNPFKLKRKANKFTPSTRLYNAITNIEYMGKGEARCLKVDSNDELFVANDFLLTHNTTLISLIFPLHQLTFGLLRFLLMISESEQQSMLNLETLGDEIEFNPKYKFFFGDRMGKTWGKESKEIIIKRHNNFPNEIGKILIRGTGQKVRGLKFGAWRPSVIVDDGEGDGNTVTEAARQKFRKWLNASVIPGCADGFMAFIGTIIDPESYLNRIAGSGAWVGGKYIRKGWKHRFFQSILQDTKPGEFIGRGKEVLDKEGVPKVLWKDRRPYEWLKRREEELRSEGDIQFFYQEYQNIPTDDSFRIFKKADIQYWEGEPMYDKKLQSWFLSVDKIKGRFTHDDIDVDTAFPVNIFIGVDPASSENVRADYTVIKIIAKDNCNNTYVLEYFRGQVNPMDGAEELWRLMNKYAPHKDIATTKQLKLVNIEKTGHEMLSGYMYKLSKESGRFFPIEPREALGSKMYRIMGMQPKFAHGAMLIKEDMAQLESELLNFRKDGKTKKDCLDALYWAMEDSFPPYLEMTKKKWIEPEEENLEEMDWLIDGIIPL